MKKYKGIVLSLLISILLLGGLIGISKFINSPSSGAQIIDSLSNGLLSAEETSFDFGNVSMAAGNVSYNFKIKNTGSEPLTIGKIYTSCMCTSALLKINNKDVGPFGMLGHDFIPSIKEVLNPGEVAEVEVVFDPAAHGPAGLGKVNRIVTLENNGQSGKLEISFDANVIP